MPYFSLHPRIVFFGGSISFLFGCFLGSLDSWVFFGGLLSVLYGHGMLMSRKVLVFLLFLLCLWSGLLFGRHSLELHMRNQTFLSEATSDFSRSLSLDGEVGSLLREDDRYSYYRVNLHRLPGSTKDNISIQVKIPKNLTIEIGDQITWTGKIQPMSRDRESSYQISGYLKGIYGQATLYGFSRIPPVKKPIGQRLREVRTKLQSYISTLYPGDVAGLLSGMLVGDTSHISRETTEDFRLSGLSHLLAVSGSNITFLLIIIEKIIRYFRFRKAGRMIVVVFGILGFLLLAGFDPPVIRATIMGVLSYIGLSAGYRVESLMLLLVIMVGYGISEPLNIGYNISLMLSFFATSGILLGNKFLGKKLSPLKKVPLLKEGVLITLSATIGTLPYILMVFGYTPIFGMISNILVEPVVGWIMSFGILSLCISMLWHTGGYLIGWIPYVFISWIGVVARLTSSLDPGYTMNTDSVLLSLGAGVGVLVFMIFLFWYTTLSIRIRKEPEESQPHRGLAVRSNQDPRESESSRAQRDESRVQKR